jgi:pyruvate formate lyase activating enzyme
MLGDLSAIVFNIQRASINDGPGIRTTVFLKGCPLDCEWCHNPEGKSPIPQISLNQDKCLLCGKCCEVCGHDVHLLLNGYHEINQNNCNLCGVCIEECPQGALKIIGKEMSVDEILDVIRADIDFYKSSGGGMTLSGGEPLFQYKFSQELLKRCKEEGIDTCLETSGFAPSKIFEGTIENADYLLFDYKLSDNTTHKKYTGVENTIILSNLEIAYNSKMQIVLRCLIVPGINDTDEHFSKICELNKNYPLLKGIELMTYHNMGISKAKNIGVFNNNKRDNVAQNTREQWLARLKEMGCDKVKLG